MISVVTPVHKASSPFLIDTYKSLQNQQGNIEWEWIICPNAGGRVPEGIAKDPHIRLFPISDDRLEYNSIGRLKYLGFGQAKGNILVELDADDMLTSDAFEEISKAFEDKKIAMVYSNSAQFENKTWKSSAYSEYWGWRSRPLFFDGHELKEMIAWEPCSQMMRRTEWAPNHVRAWRKSAYAKVGGHNPKLKSGDDHDLCCRFYLAYGSEGIKHIDKCLYLYRIYEGNSCRLYNRDVQRQTLKNYLRYSRAMAIRWAKDESLDLLDLGGRLGSWKGFKTVDLMGADIITDLNERWPFKDSSVGIIRASHIFEHVKSPIHTMNEAYRVLAPGGWLFIEVPSTDGRGAFQDPTHVSFWNENSIWYYTNKNYSRYIPAYKGRFQNSRTITYFPTDFERKHNIPIVQADLIALKPPYSDRPVGEILI